MMLGAIEVHAGDFKSGKNSSFNGRNFRLKSTVSVFKEKIPGCNLVSLTLAGEEDIKTFTGSFGAGLVGGILLGPAGLVAGALAGGRKKQVTFIAEFCDGRKFLGTTDSKTYTMLQAQLLTNEKIGIT